MKNIKKYLIALSVLTILISPSFSSAATVEELQAQINALMLQIQQLQAQLAQLHGPAPVWCHDFNVNLSIGHEADSELGALWTALAKEGFSVQAGKFDETTASAVSGFQQKYTSEILTPWGLQYGTGFVGKTTRAKLNKLYGCGIECPLYSLPLCKEGEKIVSGGYAANGCALPGKCVPIVVCAPPPCPEGDYTHYNTGKISAYGCPIIICVPISGNQPPVISGVSGPTALKIGETGTWTVKASDPEQGVLSYSVRWGDENITGAYSAAQRNWSYTQSATFTHSYASAEVYNPTFTVTDNQGLSAKTSISVQVGEVTTPSSITVLSPNGGENLIDGNTYTISWKSDNAPAGSTVGLRYVKMEEITAWDTGVKWWAESGFSIPFQTPPNLPTTGTFTFVPRIPCDDCGYSYHVDPTFKYYRIKAILFPPGTANYGSSGYAEDFSDTNFTVTMPAGVTRSLKITYPTKDDVLMAGGAGEYPIEWTSSGITADTNIDINWNDVYGMNPAEIASTKNTNSYNQFAIPNLSWWGTLPRDKNINLAAYDQYGVVIARDVSEPFHIVAPTSSTSQVWNLTLSGPATIKKGTSLTVKWSSSAPTGWAPIKCRMWFDGTQTLINDLPGSGSYSFPTDSLTVGQSYAYRLRCFDTGWVLKNYNYHTVDVPNSEGNALGKSVLISQ